MRRTLPRSTRVAVAGIASLALFGLTACSDDSDSDNASDTSSESPSETESESEAPTEEPTVSEDDESAASGSQPEWANPVTTPGEKITTIEAGDMTVDVYQVGTTKATKTGQFVDPDTNKPLLAVGDEIVFVNYVATNNGDDIDLGSSGVSVEARYDDWPYMQGMDSVVDDALFEAQEVNDGAFAPGSYVDPPVYTFGSGQVISFGENFIYQKGSPITFEVSVTPVDAEGELLHDERIEAEGAATIS
ncbi:hypothetical protein [Nocardioides sp. cx-173]|uniref:hypothetical protein n=1 Tax=Nocardioides sp. cx-173 TaxID=2898796 RepID=UPI001E3B773B|nr:hypothetical protein [Nocardioides sp. cx-173]MCD4525118.1 hypothetical protein [Nocardioides sp. cx-173]UGB40179.1 hypothetical protein LQ940_12335 [Nocardioides sp. cx-173]